MPMSGREDQGGFETNLENRRIVEGNTPTATEISKILRNEDSFQNHLKEIDMALEGHTNTTEGAIKSTIPKEDRAKLRRKR